MYHWINWSRTVDFELLLDSVQDGHKIWDRNLGLERKLGHQLYWIRNIDGLTVQVVEIPESGLLDLTIEKWQRIQFEKCGVWKLVIPKLGPGNQNYFQLWFQNHSWCFWDSCKEKIGPKRVQSTWPGKPTALFRLLLRHVLYHQNLVLFTFGTTWKMV